MRTCPTCQDGCATAVPPLAKGCIIIHKYAVSPPVFPVMTTTDSIRVDRPITNSRLFAHTRWDAVPALASLFHLLYFYLLFYLYPRTSLWIRLILGFIYSLMMNANINGIGHNFIH